MTDAVPTPPPDTDNRRNHYRVLHVQPEAPIEIIKASYRTLMTRLKVHPDLGGSHLEAALINQAWAVLGDADRRAAYDERLRRRGEMPPLRPSEFRAAAVKACGEAARGFKPFKAPQAKAAPGKASGDRAGQAGRARTASQPGAAAAGERQTGPEAAQASPPPSPARPQPAPARPHAGPGGAQGPAARADGPALHDQPSCGRHHCPLCGHVALAEPGPDSLCLNCQAPLGPLPEPGSLGHELLGRRSAARRSQDHAATLRIGHPSPGLPVRWRDLSLTGVSFFAPQPLAVGQRVRLTDAALDAVAEVVASRPQGRLYSVHARLVSARMLQRTGVFCSTSA